MCQIWIAFLKSFYFYFLLHFNRIVNLFNQIYYYNQISSHWITLDLNYIKYNNFVSSSEGLYEFLNYSHLDEAGLRIWPDQGVLVGSVSVFGNRSDTHPNFYGSGSGLNNQNQNPSEMELLFKRLSAKNIIMICINISIIETTLCK